METKLLASGADCKKYFSKFQEGNEKGLEFFYELLYPSLYSSGLRYIKDDVNAHCIVSEVFLRLWLARRRILDTNQLVAFVKKLTADGCKAYYRTATNRFNRNMLRLDEIENYQEFLIGYDPLSEIDSEIFCLKNGEEESQKQWKQINAIIPNLNPQQQLFIRLCIKYSFDYGRIAFHIGGISDYQVARKVEQTLLYLKSIITDIKKLNLAANVTRFRFEGDISSEQSAILRMRYELAYSFEEISKQLHLRQGYVQQAFVNASIKIKKHKI